ncbi:MAG: sulfotransferase [Sphingomonas bacterium]|nr:sulfotransferase [Sphingomonas bacterium]
MPRAPSPFPAATGRTGPGGRHALLQAAKRAIAAGHFAEARQLLAAPLRDQFDDPAMLGLAGLAHRGLGDALGAIDLLKRAIALAPDLVLLRIALGETLIDAHRAAPAMAVFDALPPEARAQRPVILARATALGLLGDEAGEVAALRQLLVIDDDHPTTRLRLGHALRAMGEVDEAIALYRAILIDHPHNGPAWWSLANSKAVRFDDRDRAVMNAALVDPGLADDERVRIGFALGRAEESAGEHARSFATYAAANTLRHASSKHDPDRLERQIAAATDLYTADFFAQRAGHGSRSDAPIFIVGMQRSGSTLVEQMLASHPAIEGTAELPHINQLMRELKRAARRAGTSVEHHIAALGAADTKRLGEEYLARAATHRHSDRPLFLDKMPNNWAHLGLIGLILPRARVIDVRRHPMACGWSNYRQLYATGIEHCYSLDQWAHYYRCYVEHMAHLDRVRPGRVARLVYERLVDDPERELRHLCATLDLAFDPAMLDFHRNQRTVRTISAAQVRRPLHRKAIDEWRVHEASLAPLTAALGSVLETWDAPPEGRT